MNADMDEIIKELQKEYLSSMPNKISNIERLLANQDIKGLREAFHKLKGTGKTYGIPEISILGEKIEKLCLMDSPQVNTSVKYSIVILTEVMEQRTAGKAVNLDEHPLWDNIKKAS